MTAPAAAAWLRDHLLALSHQRLDRINSIATDTCATMRRMWIEIKKFEDLKHCFFIPCDSHGIQLLVKDVMTLIPQFNETIQQAQSIVKSFRHAPLQYARLHEFQMQCYGKHQSLVLSVITRWGTQYLLVLSVLKNKDAIKRYASEFQSHPASERLKQEALDAIMDREMWSKLEALREVLQPIDERLRMSESGKSHLGHVLGRWKDILKHLHAQSKEHKELASFLADGSDGGFVNRYNRQVLDIHIVAYYLMPETTLNDIQNESAAIPIGFERQIKAFFRRHSFSDEHYRHLWHQFNCFWTQQPPFEAERQCWEEFKDPYLFWRLGLGLANSLATISIRIFSAPVNSVASERAFSIQNLIHSKTRSRLHPYRANKLAFIYTSARVLDEHDNHQHDVTPPDTARVDFNAKPLDSLTQEEEVRLENILLDIEEEDEGVSMGQNIMNGFDEEIFSSDEEES